MTTAEQWTLSGSISFRAKQKGGRAELEKSAEEMLNDICQYASGKYKDFDFTSLPAAVHQPLVDRLR